MATQIIRQASFALALAASMPFIHAARATTTMASNAAASSLGSLCHLPVGTTTMGGTITLDWDYPLAFP